MAVPFMPPRGGRDSQEGDAKPVPSAFWQPPEAVQASRFWRYQKGGIFLGWSGETPIGVRDDRHIMTVAGARAGKTSTLLIPNLHLYEGAAVVLDPKGELATATAQYRADTLGHIVHVLDPWNVANVPARLRSKFNPLADLAAADAHDLIDDAALIAEALIEDAGENNSHWTSSARDFLRAAILWFVEAQENMSLAQLPDFLADCIAVDANTPFDENPFAFMLDFKDGDTLPAVGDVIRNAGKGMMGTPAKERASILSTARNQLGFLESGQMRDNLARSSFRLSDIKAGSAGKPVYSVKEGDIAKGPAPVTVYLCLPASRMGTHAKWLRMFLNMTMATLERVRAKPRLPVLLMLEEFAALGHMRALEQASAYMAGFGVKLWVVLQDLTQLQRHYKEGWETFIGNCGVLSAFGGADMTTLDYLSKRLGQSAVYVEESTDRNEGDLKAGKAATKRNFQRVPLLAPEEIAVEFGRAKSRVLLLAADGVPVAADRRYIDDPAFKNLIKRG